MTGINRAIKYACTALCGTNKTGVIKPDANGYYRVVLGAFNFTNSSGIFYDYESSKNIFENSSAFMRRIKNGNLYAEQDHPAWESGTPLEDYVARIKRIEHSNVCAHIRDVEVVAEETDAKGRRVMVVYGSVKPFGEKGKLLAEAFENPDQNVCFSLRSLCDDKVIGRQYTRTVTDLITFDWVIEPGISKAHKYNAPGLESFALESMQDFEIPQSVIENLVSRPKAQLAAVGLESADLDGLQHVLDVANQHKVKVSRPSSLNW